MTRIIEEDRVIKYIGRELYGDRVEIQVPAKIFEVNPMYGGRLTALTVHINNVNMGNFSLRMFEQFGESAQCDHVILFDNGSFKPHVFEMLKQFVVRRGEGTVVRLESNTNAQGPLEIVGQLDFLSSDYLLYFENDVEVLKPGGIKRLFECMTPGVFAVSRWMPEHDSNIGGVVWHRVLGIASDYGLHDVKILKEVVLEVGASGYWNKPDLMFYDNLVKHTQTCLSRGYKMALCDLRQGAGGGDYVIHYGGVTTARIVDSPRELLADVLYWKLTRRLVEMGVSCEELHYDKYPDEREIPFGQYPEGV